MRKWKTAKGRRKKERQGEKEERGETWKELKVQREEGKKMESRKSER